MDSEAETQWYVLRDLTRANAKLPAYKKLSQLGFRVFTPMRTRVTERLGRRIREQIPFIHDLLFVQAAKDDLDKVILRTDTLQYRYMRGHAYRTPMTVPAAQMEHFINATGTETAQQYFTPDELTPQMYGARIRIIGQGVLNGIEGRLLKIKGSGKKRLLVELPGILAAAIQIDTADYIEIL